MSSALRKHTSPELAEMQGLDGFDAAGEPLQRAPKTDINVQQLPLHTAGFGYAFFNPDPALHERRTAWAATHERTRARCLRRESE